MLRNSRFIDALHRKPVDATPVWLMRQAGRYLPEYRALREQAGSFMNLCRNPEWACEVTLQPIRRFELDAAILFSDILTIPDAMGLGLSFETGQGPAFERPIRSLQDIKQLYIPDPETELKYVLDAIRLIKKELDHALPLIGFCGSPWTIATYMIEGRAHRDFPRIRKMIQQAPKALHKLLKILATAIARHLQAQAAAGADAVMIFDTWGGMLSTADYYEYSLPYMAYIVAQLKQTPSILFTKGGGDWLEKIADTGCTAIGLDWETDISDARLRVGDRVALQGNLNPEYLYESPDILRERVQETLRKYGPHPGHIFNLGHGVRPDMSPDQIRILVDTVHKDTQYR